MSWKQSLGHRGRHLPRYRPEQLEHEQRNIDQAVRQQSDPTTPIPAGGDKRQLRGIPVIGSAAGASPGTDPVKALLEDEDALVLRSAMCYRVAPESQLPNG